MKLIVRADDFGYTKTHNDGTMLAINEGIVTSVDIMLDTPGTLDALTRIKDFPWISMGWHAHFWGKPILDPSEVPSMVDEHGNFKFRKDQSLKATCVYEEVLKECHAQMQLCLEVTGRVPDLTWIQPTGTEFERARMTICEEYGIPYNVAAKPNHQGELIPAREPYRHLKMYMPNQPATVYKICYSNDYSERVKYDPVKYYLEDEGQILDKEIVITAWHPGFLDPYVMNESRMRECRVKDVEALCSPVLKAWIIREKVELINNRDALYGTSEYQNHLKSIQSPLFID